MAIYTKKDSSEASKPVQNKKFIIGICVMTAWLVFVVCGFLIFTGQWRPMKKLPFGNILFPNSPWRVYLSYNCYIGIGCLISEDMQKYNYWIDQAIEKKDLKLCDNLNEMAFGDMFSSKEAVIAECKQYVLERL